MHSIEKSPGATTGGSLPGFPREKKAGATEALLDELIEEAAIIWLRERDGEPCSLMRALLRLICHEYTAQAPLNASAPPVATATPQEWNPSADWQLRAAHDDTFTPDPDDT